MSVGEGFIYAFQNPSPMYNGILKIGMTDNSIENRLQQANTHTYRSNIIENFPKWICVLAKKVANATEKEKIIHKLLDINNLRIEREFFRISLQSLKDNYFIAINGKYTYDLTKSISNPISSNTNNISIIKQPLQQPQQQPQSHPQQQSQQQSPPINKNITIMDIYINKINENQRKELLEIGLSKRCLEARMIKGYYFFDKIKNKEIYLSSDMRFNAILNSPYLGYINVSSDNFDEVIEATQRSIEDSKVLRSGMLSDLLSGEHEIPESYDKVMGAA